MRYDITEPPHPLLSPTARQLKREELVEQNEIAEMVLEVDTGTVYTDPEKVASMLRYVTLQVNLQVELDVDAFAYSSVSEAGRSRTYRDTLSSVPVNPIALAGVRRLATGGEARGFTSTTSRRRCEGSDSDTEAGWRMRGA